jgi:VanZ family protein
MTTYLAKDLLSHLKSSIAVRIATLAAWIGVIFFSSTGIAEYWSEKTFCYGAAQLFGTLRVDSWLYRLIHFSAEKSVHVSLFMILAGLLSACMPGSRRKIPLILFIAAIIGSTSEYLQSLFPGRDPAFRDVCINFLGAAAGSVLILLGQKRYKHVAPSFPQSCTEWRKTSCSSGPHRYCGAGIQSGPQHRQVDSART